MDSITLELDCVEPVEGPWELAGMAGMGAVVVEITNPCGPAGGNPVITVTGSRAAVIMWLLYEYLGAREVGELVLETILPAGR